MVPGEVSGVVMRLEDPLSFWGGVDPNTGVIIDSHHSQTGQSVSDRILVMPFGRGSSSASSVIAESIRSGTGPKAILLSEPDEIIALGAIVADELYSKSMPVLVLEERIYNLLRTGEKVSISLDGAITQL